MTMKHTPGPWSVDPFPLDIENACQCLLESMNSPRGWAAVAVGSDADGYEHVSYCHPDNAPLISAAPDMLAALELAVERLEINDCEGEEAEALAVIRAAIAKAKGVA